MAPKELNLAAQAWVEDKMREISVHYADKPQPDPAAAGNDTGPKAAG
jgi:hypothetical protein